MSNERTYLRLARAVSGVLAVALLLVLLFADAFNAATLTSRTLNILLILISALLGVDLVADNLPLKVKVTSPDEDEGDD